MTNMRPSDAPNSTVKVLKGLMQGLIYPAVLGTVLYTALDQLKNLIDALFHPELYVFDSNATLKLTLLLISTAFYFCDYLYLTLTNNYRRFFFCLDIVFVLGFYWTVELIGIRDPYSPPSVPPIIGLYLLFVALYCLWDIAERERCCDQQERRLYNEVIIWEVASMALLIAEVVLFFRRGVRSLWFQAYFVAGLVSITYRFAYLVWKKKEFYTGG